MSTPSDVSLTAAWNQASASMNRYVSIVIYLFGTIGNLLNALVLSQEALRRNPCSLFFLTSSIANLAVILSGLTTRILSGWTLDLTNTVDWLCKLRGFALFLSRNTAAWLIMFAAFDRWLLSCANAHRRRWSTLKNAQRSIVAITLLSALLYSPLIYCYEANLVNAPLRCYGKNEFCRFSNDFSYAFLTIILPLMLMMLFGLLTINNIHHIKSRVQVATTIELAPVGLPSVEMSTARQMPLSSKRRLDRRLFMMLITQVILLGLCTVPQGIQKIYSTFTANLVYTPLRQAINNFFFNLLLLLTYVGNGMPFYIYTLSGGEVFRNALKQAMQTIGRKLCVTHRLA